MAGHVKRHSRMIMKRLLLMGLIVVSVGNTVAHAAANEGPIHVNNNGAQLIRNTTKLGLRRVV